MWHTLGGWCEAKRQGEKRKPYQTFCEYMRATLHLSLNHVADLGQGSWWLWFTDLHDSFGLVKTHHHHRFIIPSKSSCPTLTHSWQRLPVSCKQSGKSTYSASHTLILEPTQICSSSFAPPGSSTKSPPMTACPSMIVSPFNIQHSTLNAIEHSVLHSLLGKYTPYLVYLSLKPISLDVLLLSWTPLTPLLHLPRF